MTIRQSGMTVRKRLMIRALCLIIFCSLVIYVIQLYRNIYSGFGRKSFFRDRLGSHAFGDNLEGSVMPQFSGDGSGAAAIAVWDDTQGSTVVDLREKLVHFDLKGMPPTVEAYKTIFPFLRKIGVTGVLMEYEDMFPFHGKLQSIANKAAYNVSDIKTILGIAKSNNLQVIPLVQTFGHLEFILKLEDYVNLREVGGYPQVICPTNNKSSELLHEMIDQVMNLHPGVEYLHIGSDEVYYLGLCPLCQDRMNRFKMDPADLFLSHATHIASYVRDKHNVQPIMWDDEFRNLDERLITKYGIGNLVEILIWNYHPDVHNRIRPNVWEKYAKIFKAVWIGSAFKGADKPNSIMANETHYLSNHYSWMDVISEYQHRVNIKGIFLTGWQRYDHFSTLCEIFPVAIPSLVSCMFYLNGVGRQPRMEKIFSLASTYLDCGSDMLFCRFPGSQIYSEVLTLSGLQSSMKRIKEQSIYLGWAQNVNLNFQFSSPSHIESVLQEVVKLRVELDRLQTNLFTQLRSMYPDWSVQEWMYTHFLPLATEVNSLESSLGKLSKKITFPVRPLKFPDVAAEARSSQGVQLNDL
ncbi:unnamed protein product [Orchesella dallaii]|uniref:beta-N-acetylhexosaminidase n=1 Tax=Orchesella dallaii TaxID=48710 RepID=A0ABP1RW01_9HEXA